MMFPGTKVKTGGFRSPQVWSFATWSMTFHRFALWVTPQISILQGTQPGQAMLEQGLISRLIDLTKSDDRRLRLNALWAFKNLLHRGSTAQK